jgi:hypothetical protein
MKPHRIILTEDPSLSIPGYKYECVNDLVFHFDLTRITNEEVEEIITLWKEEDPEENDNYEKVKQMVDWFPDTSALRLSEN